MVQAFGSALALIVSLFFGMLAVKYAMRWIRADGPSYSDGPPRRTAVEKSISRHHNKRIARGYRAAPNGHYAGERHNYRSRV